MMGNYGSYIGVLQYLDVFGLLGGYYFQLVTCDLEMLVDRSLAAVQNCWWISLSLDCWSLCHPPSLFFYMALPVPLSLCTCLHVHAYWYAHASTIGKSQNPVIQYADLIVFPWLLGLVSLADLVGGFNGWLHPPPLCWRNEQGSDVFVASVVSGGATWNHPSLSQLWDS